MPCYHPLFGQKTYRPDGKVKVKILGSKFDWDFLSDVEKLNSDYVTIPCGQCIGCRLEYSRQWAIRCVLESKSYPSGSCWFLTLTYDEEHLPVNSFACDPDSGEVLYPTSSLIPDHLTKFMKDLRRYYDYHYGIKDIRFFGCGEYGSKRCRPHFHILVFGLPIFDLKPYPYKKSSSYSYYSSDILSGIWKNGLLCVGELTFESCAYTARYILKKQTGPGSDLFYKQHGLVPEFTRMSRNPGIGRFFYDNNKVGIYDSDSLGVAFGKHKFVPKPVAYYDRLFDVENPERMAEVKLNRRRVALENDKLLSLRTSLPPKDYMKLLEDVKQSTIDKCLTRPI